MFEAYSVGITLRLNNLVSPQLALLARDMEKLEALSVGLKSTLRTIGAESAGLRAIASASNASAVAMDRATRSASALNQHMAALRANAATMPHLGAAAAGAAGGGGGGGAAAAGAAAAAAGGGRRGGRGGGGAGGGGVGGNWNNTGLHGGNVHMGPGGIGVGSVGFGVGGAIVPLAATVGTVYVAHSLYEAAKEYETAYTRFKTLNLGDEVNRQASAFARGSHTFGVSSKDMIETVRESVGMFGNMKMATQLSPIIAQLNAANSGLFGGKIGKIDEGTARSLMRFNDMRGLTDSPQDFMRGLNLAQRMVTGSGGALNFQQLEQLAKRGGAAFKGLSDDGIMMLGTLAQEQGGATTGTALMSLYQNLVAGRTTKKTMAALEAAGLVTLGQVNSGTVGGKKSTSTVISSILDEKMLRENPGQWLMTYGTAAAKKAGASTDSEIVSFMNKLVSNRTGSNMAANFTTQQAQAMRDFNLSKNAMGAEQTVGAWKGTLGGKEADFMAAWSDFKTEFGTSALPAFSNLLTNATGALRNISSFMDSPGLKSFAEAYKNPGNFYRGLFGLDKKADGAPGTPSGGFASNGGGAAFGNPNIRGAAPQMVQVESTTVLDGKVLARTVSSYQAKELSRPSTGPRTADGRMSLRAFDVSTGG